MMQDAKKSLLRNNICFHNWFQCIKSNVLMKLIKHVFVLKYRKVNDALGLKNVL